MSGRPELAKPANPPTRHPQSPSCGAGLARYRHSMPSWTPPNSVNLVDLGFMDARSKLIDLAAFLDRVQRAGQDGDFRVQALKNAIAQLSADAPSRAREVLLSFSDPSTQPIEKATMQGAIGAHNAG